MAPVGRVATTRGVARSGWISLIDFDEATAARLTAIRLPPTTIVLTGTDATSGTRSRAASHRPSDDRRVDVQPVDTGLGGHLMHHPRQVTTLSDWRRSPLSRMKEPGATWRRSLNCASVITRDAEVGDRDLSLAPPALLAQTSMSLPAQAHPGCRELDRSAKHRRRFPDRPERIVFRPKMG